MNTLLLRPTDVLFFKDGRPMSGSLSGDGAGWPLPTVISAALHAALHRAGIEDAHGHDHQRDNGKTVSGVRRFGSLVSAGPFPVDDAGRWFFPRPLDSEPLITESEDAVATPTATYRPLKGTGGDDQSSLPRPLKYPVANTREASKTAPKSWWSGEAWKRYLTDPDAPLDAADHFKSDTDFCDTEFNYGIGLDPATGTQDGDRFYSARYLRLREGWRLGCFAEAFDKKGGNPKEKRDLIEAIFPNSGSDTPIIAGGQRRICTVQRHNGDALGLPEGKTNGFPEGKVKGETRWLVKWVLLTPAIWPEIPPKTRNGADQKPHPGGWLPNWVSLDWNPETRKAQDSENNGAVLLKRRTGKITRRFDRDKGKHVRKAEFEESIDATLVAAMVDKPIPVTGYALPHESADRERGGPKSTHLAVPAGSVYYFAAASKEAAEKLAAALNWHGDDPADAATEIHHRRSTLMGEKGFGLGVCAGWHFHDGNRPGGEGDPAS